MYESGPRKQIRLERRSPTQWRVIFIKSRLHPADTHAALATMHPVGHMDEISDIVDAVLYLESAGFVTGEILHVDSGQSAGH